MVFSRRRVNRQQAQKQQTKNMMLTGQGASGVGDRGAFQSASVRTSNPYFSNNFMYRWQEYARWYMTSWEARKIIDIPVEDALRIPFEITGVNEAMTKKIMSAFDALDLTRQNRRALIQERLFGGCVQTIITAMPKDAGTDPWATTLYTRDIQEGDLKAINVVDISRIARADVNIDPFSVNYDRAEAYYIQGIETHTSRLVVFDGSPLLNRNSMNLLQNYRYNPAGFAESKLAPLYDLLVRVVGTQEAAYHLVNLASIMVMKADNLISLKAGGEMGQEALQELEKICNQVSIYRAAILDQKGAELQSQPISFGSVPELLMSFAQLLSAGSDVPATRFLGTAPGGLNATGESDLQNYYNMIDSYQQQRIKPVIMKQLSILGPSIMPQAEWAKVSETLDIEFPPLWNDNLLVQAQTMQTKAEIYRGWYMDGLINRETAVQEMQKLGMFDTSRDIAEFLADEEAGSPLGTEGVMGIGDVQGTLDAMRQLDGQGDSV